MSEDISVFKKEISFLSKLSKFLVTFFHNFREL